MVESALIEFALSYTLPDNIAQDIIFELHI